MVKKTILASTIVVLLLFVISMLRHVQIHTHPQEMRDSF